MTPCSSLAETILSKPAARRRKVIETARMLFADNGFHATGIAQIAKQSGIAVGQIYRDFACKEDIVAAIVEIDCATFMNGDSLNAAVVRGDLESVRDWIHGIILSKQQDDNNGQLFAEIVAESSRNSRIATIFATVQSFARTNMLTAIGAFAPCPSLAPKREILADTVLTLSLGLLMHRLMRGDLGTQQLVDSLLRVIDRDLDEIHRANAAAVMG